MCGGRSHNGARRGTADPTCQVLPAFRSLIDHALLVDRQNTQEQCPSLREAFQSGVTELRGVPINREALGRYLGEYC